MNRQLWLLAALVTVALISAGCGSSGPSGTGTANSTTNGTGSTRTGTGRNATGQDKAVKFAKCMRSNGVSEFPDPGASGKLTIDAVANGSSLNTSTPAFKGRTPPSTSTCSPTVASNSSGCRAFVTGSALIPRTACCI